MLMEERNQLLSRLADRDDLLKAANARVAEMSDRYSSNEQQSELRHQQAQLQPFPPHPSTPLHPLHRHPTVHYQLTRQPTANPAPLKVDHTPPHSPPLHPTHPLLDLLYSASPPAPLLG